MTRFNNYDLDNFPPVLAWNPVVMRCPGCGLDADPTYHAGKAAKRCWHLRACDMHAQNPRIPNWQRRIKAGVSGQLYASSIVLLMPEKRKCPAVIATQFMGDIGQLVPGAQKQILDAARSCPQHVFLWLTKWPEYLAGLKNWPDNVWLGTSASTQEDVNNRVPKLIATSSQHLWFSGEPMLGPMDISPFLGETLESRGIEFIAAGPETGPHASSNPAVRTRMDWLAYQCESAAVPFYDKRDPSNPWFIRREWPVEWREKVKV
jgi:protein gp37